MTDNKTARLWNKNFILIVLASTGISFGTYFFLPTLPIYAESISNSAAWAGSMTTIFAMASFISRPIAGYLVDRLPRKSIAILGAAVCMIASLLYNLAGTIMVLVVIRFLHGFGMGMHSTSVGTIAVDLIPPSRRVEGLGNYGVCMTIASATAPAIALPLIINYENGLSRITILSAFVTAITLATLLMLKYKNAGIKTPRAHGKFYFPKASMQPAAMLFVISIIQGAVISFIAIYALEKGFGAAGLFFTLSSVAMIATRLFMGKVGDRHGAAVIMIPAMILLIVSLAGIVLAESGVVLISMGIPFGLALGSVNPLINAVIVDLFPDGRKGAAIALFYSCIDTGIGAGAIAGGILAALIGYRGVYTVALILCAIIFIWYVVNTAVKKTAANADSRKLEDEDIDYCNK